MFRHGPQPYEALLSVICEAFHCTPDAAARQDWRTVKAILDCRMARWAVDTFNDKEHGMATMQRHPEIMDMLSAMIQAQTGEDDAGARAALATMRQVEDDG